jgi:hypothetical protein
VLQQATAAIVKQTVKLKKDKKDGTTTIVLPGLNATLDDESEEEAAGLLYHFRAMKISVRNLYGLRRRCRRATLDMVRRQLTPYVPRHITFQPGLGRERCGSVVELADLVATRIRLAVAQRRLQITTPALRVIVSVDATSLWRTSATRCDVYVDVYADKSKAGLPENWATWFVFDGGDDADPLRIADREGKLNLMVESLQRDGVVAGGHRYPVLCYLTGDGKGMPACNHEQGLRCWHCDLAYEDFGGEQLYPSVVLLARVRWGAFLADIPPERRVGDMAHCACRVVGCVLKRLQADTRVQAKPALVAALRRMVADVGQDAAHIPSDMRLLVRPNKDGAVNIATAQVFLSSSARHAELVTLVEDHLGVVRVDGEPVGPPFHALLRSLFSALAFMNKCWRSKEGFKWQQYAVAVDEFARAFRALGWKPAVWLHWVCCHSTELARLYGNFFIFSTIPTERRHVSWKMDIRHSFQGWKLKAPHLARRGLTHSHALDSLDIGVRIWLAEGGEPARWVKRKRMKL